MAQNKIPFRTLMDCSSVFFNSNGSPLRPKYHNTVLENGSVTVVQYGVTDFDALIQESLDETLVYNILAKAEGDPSLLHTRRGFYFDSSTVPKNIFEFHNLHNRMKDQFFNLPDSLRNSFDNDPERFVSGILDGSVDRLLSMPVQVPSNPSSVSVAESEV